MCRTNLLPFFFFTGTERWNAWKKVVLRSTDRGPGTPLELPLERPSGTPTVNPPTVRLAVRCAASEVACHPQPVTIRQLRQR
jgi:hypothetical protein